jgi:hypothetical protein
MAHIGEAEAASGVALLNEGFEMADTEAIIGSFARHLMTAFDQWNERGFDPVARDYLDRLFKENADEQRGIDINGDLLIKSPALKGPPARHRLVQALARAAWYDPKYRAPKLG